MKVVHYEQIEAAPVTMEGSAGCRIRCLVGEPDGAPSFSMRQFEVAPGGHTPQHAHAYEHEVFVLEGAGTPIRVKAAANCLTDAAGRQGNAADRSSTSCSSSSR